MTGSRFVDRSHYMATKNGQLHVDQWSGRIERAKPATGILRGSVSLVETLT